MSNKQIKCRQPKIIIPFLFGNLFALFLSFVLFMYDNRLNESSSFNVSTISFVFLDRFIIY